MLGKGKVSQSMIDAVNKVLAKEDKITKTPEPLNSPQKLDESFPTVADAKKRMADAENKKFDTKKISTGTVYTKKNDEKKETKNEEVVEENMTAHQKRAHEYNLDAAQREIDRRHAEGEDMTGAKIHNKTYEIIKPKKQGVSEAFPTVADAKKRMADAEKKKFDTKKISTGTVYTKKHDADKVKDDEKDEMKSESKKTFSAFQSRLIESLKSADSLEEALSKDAAASAWIHDFVHSDNPKFAGKSMKKRKEMALAAYYSKQRNEALDYSKTTTDTLAGRVKGGKPNEHSSFKVKLEDSEEHEDHDDEEEDK